MEREIEALLGMIDQGEVRDIVLEGFEQGPTRGNRPVIEVLQHETFPILGY